MEALATESLPERIKPNNVLEFVYDDFVWVVIEHGLPQSRVRGICSSETLATQLISTICKTEHTEREWFDFEKWPIIRHYAEILRRTGPVGQVSKSD